MADVIEAGPAGPTGIPKKIHGVHNYKGMAGTFSQVYVQVVFAVRGRRTSIDKAWKDELYKYIAGIIREKGQKSIIVNGMPDHVHVFIGLKPSIALSDLVRDIKNNSSKFITLLF